MGNYYTWDIYTMANKSMMNNKKALLARDYVIMLIIFSVIIALGGLLVSDLNSSGEGYGVQNVTDETFSENYDRLSETTNDINLAANQTRSGFGKLLGSFDVFFSATATVFDIVFGSFSMVNSVFENFATDFGVPPQIANIIFPALLAIITTIIVFVAISSLTKTKV